MPNELEPLFQEVKDQMSAMGVTNKAIKDAQEAGEAKSIALEEKLNAQCDELKKAVDRLEQAEKAIARRNENAKPLEMSIDVKTLNTQIKAFGKNIEVDQEKAEELASLMVKYMQGGMIALSAEEQKSINTIIDPQGGYLAPETLGQIREKRFDANGLLEVVDRMTSSTGRYSEFIDWNDYEKAYKKNELDGLATITDDENFIKISWDAKTQFYPKTFSREALEDITNIETQVVGRMQRGATRSMAQELVTGKGQQSCHGILAYPEGKAFGQIERIESTVSGTLNWDDLFDKLLPALKEEYHEGASIIMNRKSFFKLISDKDGNGKYQIGDQINFFSAEGLSIAILGYPVKWEANMPDVASNSPAVAFGNFEEAYLLVERVGFSLHRDESQADRVKVTLRRRFDGKVRNFEAIKLLKIKA